MLSRYLDSFRREPQLAVVVFVGIVIAYLSLSPTLMLFYGSFRSKPLGVPSAEFTLAHYLQAYTDPLTYQLLFNSFVFAAGSSILATVLAAAVGKRDWDAAKKYISDEVVHAHSVAGTSDECRKQLSAFVAGGLNLPVLLPMGTQEARKKVVQMVREQVG